MSEFKSETLQVKPITYKLDIDDEQMKRLRPFFKVSSGSFSGITKTVKYPAQGDPKNEDEIRIRKKEKGSVLVELWDRNSSRPENLIGRGEVKYTNLSSKEGAYEEWIPLLDRNHQQIGKALVEIEVTPVNMDLSFDDMFQRSIEGMNHSFKRAIEDMNRSFDHFNRFMLPSASFPSLTEAPKQQAISSKDQEKVSASSNKEIKKDASSQGTLENREEERKSLMTPSRRNWFDSTFLDMNNMFEKTIEDMHNTFEQFTKDFFPSSFRGFLDEERGMDLEGEKPIEQSGKSQIQEDRNKENVSKSNKDKVDIQEEPLRP
jgi:hypothetical protein